MSKVIENLNLKRKKQDGWTKPDDAKDASYLDMSRKIIPEKTISEKIIHTTTINFNELDMFSIIRNGHEVISREFPLGKKAKMAIVITIEDTDNKQAIKLYKK